MKIPLNFTSAIKERYSSTITSSAFINETHTCADPLDFPTFFVQMMVVFIIILPSLVNKSPMEIMKAMKSNFYDIEDDDMTYFLNDYEEESSDSQEESSDSEEETNDSGEESSDSGEESSDSETDCDDSDAESQESSPEISDKPHPDYALKNITTIYEIGREPQVGDIIRFTTRERIVEPHIRTECDNINFGAPRCISTYGKNEIEPKPGYSGPESSELYIVVSKTNTLPNAKGIAASTAIWGDNNMIQTNNVHLIVEPLAGLDPNECVFWYINYTDLTIRQFEGACVKELIDNLEIIAHRDFYGIRTSTPSPEPVFDTDSDEYSNSHQRNENSLVADCYNSSETDSDINHQEIDYPDEYSDTYSDDYDSHVRTLFYHGDMNFNDGDY